MNIEDLEMAHSTGGLNIRHIIGVLPDQGTRNRRTHRNLALLDIGLVLTHDLVTHLFAGRGIHQHHCGPENDTAFGIQVPWINDLSIGQLALKLLDTPLDEALAFLGGIIFGVLGQVTVRARLGDRGNHRRAFDRLQVLQLFAQLIGTDHGQWYLVHARPSSI